MFKFDFVSIIKSIKKHNFTKNILKCRLTQKKNINMDFSNGLANKEVLNLIHKLIKILLCLSIYYSGGEIITCIY